MKLGGVAAVVAAASAAVLLSAHGAQDPGQRPLADNPALTAIVDAPAVITTSIPDVFNGIGVAVADEWPISPQPLASLRRDAAGNVELRPGAWEITVESFSLSIGAVAPTTQEGYLLAPLQGPRAAVVKHILDRTSAAPDVSQEDVQALLWAVLARARAATLTGGLKATAERLLSPAQVAEMDAAALGPLPVSRDQLLLFMRPSVAWALDAEAQMRALVAAGAPYAALAQTAVRGGEAESELGDRDILPGRWNHHPAGFFARFYPNGYQRTRIQVVDVGGARPRVVRDQARRVVQASYAGDVTIQAEYDDQTPALGLRGNVGARGHVFRRLRISRRNAPPGGGSPVVDLPGGWTLVGAPTLVAELPDEASPPGAILASYPDARERLTSAAWLFRGVTSLETGYLESKPTEYADLLDAEFLRVGAREAIAKAAASPPAWVRQFLEDATPAFAVVHCVLDPAACGPAPAAGRAGLPSHVLDPTSLVALSGSQQSQRLGMSRREAK